MDSREFVTLASRTFLIAAALSACSSNNSVQTPTVNQALMAGPVSAGPAPVGPVSVPGTGTRAVAANDFLSSLGINTHIDQGYNSNNYVTDLKYTGIRNIRDSIGNLSSTVALHQQTGALVDINAGCNLSGLISAAQTLASNGALLSVEGPNEPNNFPITYNGQTGGGTGTWLPVAQCQQALYSGVKASPALGQYPVFTVSEVGARGGQCGPAVPDDPDRRGHHHARRHPVRRLRQLP